MAHPGVLNGGGRAVRTPSTGCRKPGPASVAGLLVSLWDIDDAATALLMGHFYRHLRQGGSKSEALQRAVAATRQANPHPFYWAPFILVGKVW